MFERLRRDFLVQQYRRCPSYIHYMIRSHNLLAFAPKKNCIEASKWLSCKNVQKRPRGKIYEYGNKSEKLITDEIIKLY